MNEKPLEQPTGLEDLQQVVSETMTPNEAIYKLESMADQGDKFQKMMELYQKSRENHTPGKMHSLSDTAYIVSKSGAWVKTESSTSSRASHRQDVAAKLEADRQAKLEKRAQSKTGMKKLAREKAARELEAKKAVWRKERRKRVEAAQVAREEKAKKVQATLERIRESQGV